MKTESILHRSITGLLLTTLAGTPAISLAQAPVVTSTPIQHVVVIFQENVSFDHYFGTYPNALNTTRVSRISTAAPNTPYGQRTGGSTAHQESQLGSTVPFDARPSR